MEWLEVLELLAQAHEFDRLLGHRFQAQRRAAARVAVELGQNAAGDLKRLIEVRCHVDRFLPGGRIEHQQDFVRTHQVTEPNEFLHQRFVDLQAAGGVENQRVTGLSRREIARFPGDFEDVRFASLDEHRDPQLFAERGELIHGGGSIDVGGHQQGRPTLFLQQTSQFP